MITFLKNLPQGHFYLACSGGIDSMVALDFLLRGKRRPTILHFDHGTSFGYQAQRFVMDRCGKLGLNAIFGSIRGSRSKDLSQEEFWRNERYAFFDRYTNGPIVMAHQLNDVAEWYLFSALHGEAKLIPYRNGNVIRPFLPTSRDEIANWAQRKGVEYLIDPGNFDEKYMRSIVRHKILPEALRINPGFLSVLKKKVIKECQKSQKSCQ